MPQFNDENIERLFGAEDAEGELEERFRQYFFYNRTYENLISTLPIRILVGHKGVGKSALLRRAHFHDQDLKILSIWLRPDDISALMPDANATNSATFNKLVEYWKQGLLGIIGRRILGNAANELLNKETMARFTARVPAFLGVVATKLTELAGKSATDLNRGIVDNFAKTNVVNVYIDDIDRGWSASRADIQNISALINAMRDIAGGDQRIRFRLGLRSDVYFLVRTSDESTDKIERNVIWLSWTNHEILAIMAKRIETFFGVDKDQAAIIKMTQADITTQILSKVIEPKFQGLGHWSNRPIHNVLLSLTRQRPRDLVKLMQGAAKRAYTSTNTIISSRNLESSFESYSNERLQDIINEFKSELPAIDKLLLGMRPTKVERKTSESFLFSNDKLAKKIGGVMEQANFSFTSGRPVGVKSLIQFLYKIDFITARKKRTDGLIDRKYFDNNRFLADEFADFGYDWEIHPAYRWALQPQNIQAVIDSIEE